MKKIIAKIFLAVLLLAPGLMPPAAKAAVVPAWDVTGSYVWTVLGAYNHDLTLTQNSDGTFTGTGGYPAGGPYLTTETITGSVTGSGITFTTLYSGPYNTGYAVTVSGTIANDGTISGTTPWPWSMTKGSAHLAGEPDWDGQLSASACTGKIGKPVVNVAQKVTNDADSGLAGYWAMDNYVRHIQVWRTGSADSNTYCALVAYEGTANAAEGKTGPGGSGIIGAGVSAEMEGGYRATFTGTFAPTGDWQTRGSVGSADYGCDLDGNCGQIPSWLNIYFPTHGGLNQDWWGWFYDAEGHGSWMNSSDGTFGNIL